VLPHVLGVTAIFVAASVAGQLLLGLLIALIIQRAIARGLHGAVLVRSVVLSAWVMPGILIGVIWQIVLNEGPFGLVNSALSALGLGPVAWLSDTKLAVVSVVVANIWRGTAFSMILVYAGLQTIPGDVLEAAKIDGATAFQRVTRVILPLLAPILFINLVIVSIETFNTFDMVLALTGGGPGRSTEVIALSIYNQIFAQFDLGQGAATAMLLLVVSVIMTIVYIRILQREEEVI
jgi:multiple sugar transport system permease protein